MSPSIETLTANCNIVTLASGTELLFSYQTLVGVRRKGVLYTTDTKYSVTTSKHITKAGFGGGIATSPSDLVILGV